MAEEHPAIGRVEVLAVVEPVGRRVARGRRARRPAPPGRRCSSDRRWPALARTPSITGIACRDIVDGLSEDRWAANPEGLRAFGLVSQHRQGGSDGLEVVALELDPAFLDGSTGSARGLEPGRQRGQVVAVGVERADDGDDLAPGPVSRVPAWPSGFQEPVVWARRPAAGRRTRIRACRSDRRLAGGPREFPRRGESRARAPCHAPGPAPAHQTIG